MAKRFLVKAYGTTITDWKLVRNSMWVEGVSLVFCIFIGVVVGGVTGPTSLSDDWPTNEMWTRGTMSNFLVGLPIAFFSGLGVAVSLLDEQISSLVGVAISASLLPPAVNTGVVWIGYLFAANDIIHCSKIAQTPPETVVAPGNNSSDLNRLLGNAPETSTLKANVFCGNEKEEFKDYFYKAGLISLSLTLANIMLVWLASMIMFRLKEVLPIEKKVFWDDLGVARKIYRKQAVLSDTETPESQIVISAD